MTGDRRGVAVGLAVVAVVAVLDVLVGQRVVPLTAVVIAPLLASAFAGPRGTALVAVVATAAAVALGVMSGIFGTVDHALRIALVATGSVLAVWLSDTRGQREREISQAERIGALSEALQTGLLPVPALIGDTLEVTMRYRPGERLLLLGGDFYDVVEVGDGAVAFLIGDVAGHGAEAASISSALRAGWRALVLTQQDPLEWLDALNRLFATLQAGPERFVTVCTGLIDPDRGGAAVVAAGHPPPIRLTDVAELLAVKPGPPLGVATGISDWDVTDVVLGAEWGLLLYTDGLVEGYRAPGSAQRYGMESLAAWLGARRHPSRTTRGDLDRLLDDIEAANGGPFADDVAVVLIRSRAG